MIYLLYGAFIAVPILSVVWFFYSLVRYRKAVPGSELKRTSKIQLIVSSIVLGVMIAVVISLGALFAMAIAFM